MKIEQLRTHKIPCEETGITVTPAICGFCGDSCMVDLYKKDEKIIKVEGNTSLPFSKGTLCVKGAALKQATYHPERILYPMKRVGKKGEGKFERISWEEALHLIASKMTETKEKFDAKECMIYVGHPKWFRPYLADFARKYGTPNYASESSTCAYGVMIANKCTFGENISMTRPDIPNCNALLIWGVNTFYSHAPTGPEGLLSIKRRGGKIIVVDPRCTATTEYADIHLRPYPGTDGALALGMARVMIEENLIDVDYIAQYTIGFHEYKSYVMKFTPEYVESITGVPQSQMIEAARVFATQGPSAIQLSASPIVHNINGVQNVRAIQLLLALTGNYGTKGGVMPPGPAFPPLHYSFLNERIKRTREDEDLSHVQFPAWEDLIFEEAQVVRIADYLNGEGDYAVRTLVAFGMNHHMWPRPDRIENALETIDFFVNADIYMNDTCKYADVLLPVASSLEREQIEVKGLGYLYYQPRAIESLGEVKNDMEIILELSKLLGIEVGEPTVHSYEEYMETLLLHTGVTLKELREHPKGMKMKADAMVRSEEDIRRVKTVSGKIEFVSETLKKCQRAAHDALPVYRDFRDILPMKDYPLILSTGSRKPHLFHSRTYRMPWLTKLEKYPLVELSMEDAKKYGVSNGEEVLVVTPIGKMSFVASINTGCLTGVVNIYHGAGEKDINYLLPDDYIDPISGFPGYKSYCCRLEKKGSEHHE